MYKFFRHLYVLSLLHFTVSDNSGISRVFYLDTNENATKHGLSPVEGPDDNP